VQVDPGEPDQAQALAMNAGSVASKVTGLTNAEVVEERWTETEADTYVGATHVKEEDPLPEVEGAAEVIQETTIEEKEDVLVAKRKVTLEHSAQVDVVAETLALLIEEGMIAFPHLTETSTTEAATAREMVLAEGITREADRLLKSERDGLLVETTTTTLLVIHQEAELLLPVITNVMTAPTHGTTTESVSNLHNSSRRKAEI